MAHHYHNCTIFRLDYFGHKAIMPQPEDPRHNLRLTPELKKKLAHSAVDNGRSMNAEILARLDKSFDPSLGQEAESLLIGLVKLDNEERAKVVELLTQAASILSKR